jgi:protoporphyrin/coproporphyrin ferrochelatase
VSVAIVASCHGTVRDPADVPAFLLRIRRGRPASDALVAEVTRRLAHIGGSPLWDHTLAQASALEARLGVPVRAAGRLWHPFPAEVVAELCAAGVTEIVSLPLAPQSVHVYHAAIEEALKPFPGVALSKVPSYGDEPALIEAFLQTIDEAFAGVALPPSDVAVVLSAHSLPRRIVDAGDPYQVDFERMAEHVATTLRARGHRTAIAYQSQGATDDVWLGPDLAETFAALRDEGIRGVMVAPIGFVSDHVETLYDLDVDARALAQAVGFDLFLRASALNDRARFVDALEVVARRALQAPITKVES